MSYETAPQERCIQVLQQFPENCIQDMVAEFKKRPVAVAAKIETRSYFILSRDMWQTHKHKAVQQFVDWVGARYGDSKDCAKMQKGIVPRGWFAAYVRAHAQLFTACKLSDTQSVTQTNFCYKRIQKNYSRALKVFVAEQSTVVERRIVPSSATEAAVAESDPPEVDRFAKFCNKTNRLGAQYYRTRTSFVRDSCRRRGPGACIQMVCAIMREMLIMCSW